LGRVQGAKGAAIEGVHWEGDEIWAWSQFGSGGRPAPASIEGWAAATAEIDKGVGELDLGDSDEDADEDEDGQEGGVTLDPSQKPRNGDISANGPRPAPENGTEPEAEPDAEPTTAEIDNAFLQAFLYALHDAKKSANPPHYGLDFPIQPSFLIANMIQPHLRFQSQHYTIKKTSWKNTKKFIKYLEKQVLVKSKDRNGGETVILDADFDDERVKTFTPYKLPKPKTQSSAGIADETSSKEGGMDPSLGQKLTLQTLYRASSKLVPDLIPSKTTYYSSSQISSFLKKYVENNPSLTENSSSPRFIKLDPFIANNILGSNSSAADSRILAAGEVPRDALLKRIVDDSHLAIPHWLLLRNDQKYDPESPDATLKPKAGPPPQVAVVLEKRSGTKVVTKISGLEAFGINPQILGPELQKKCAGSASVGQHVGGKPGMMEILVQGDQREVVEKEVGRRGVDRRWIFVDDKTKKKKK
jgi:translation initiation factor 2D